jgi:hypothetical protein
MGAAAAYVSRVDTLEGASGRGGRAAVMIEDSGLQCALPDDTGAVYIRNVSSHISDPLLTSCTYL